MRALFLRTVHQAASLCLATDTPCYCRMHLHHLTTSLREEKAMSQGWWLHLHAEGKTCRLHDLPGSAWADELLASCPEPIAEAREAKALLSSAS